MRAIDKESQDENKILYNCGDYCRNCCFAYLLVQEINQQRLADVAKNAAVYEVISMAEYVYNGTQYVGVGEMVSFSPDYRSRSNVEHAEKWREWCDRIPTLRFDSDWDVRIIPPFGGAMARFAIKKADKHVSVYLDVFSELGAMYDEAGNPIPYYEVYDGENTPRFYLNETDEMMDYIREVLNV